MIGSTRQARSGRGLPSAALVLAGALVLGGCSQDDGEPAAADSGAADPDSGAADSDPDDAEPETDAVDTADVDSAADVAGACAQAEAAAGALDWSGPTEPVDAGGASGSEVWFITLGTTDPSILEIYAGFEEAAAEAGLRAQLFDADGDISRVAVGLQQAATNQVAAAGLYAVAADTVADDVRRASDAGVKVFDIVATEPDVRSEVAHGHVSISFVEVGRLRAAQAVCATDGDLRALYIGSEVIPADTPLSTGVREGIDEACPSCELTIVDSDPFNWPEQLPRLTTNTFRANPDLNFVMPNFGGAALFVLPALTDLGVLDEGVAINSMNANQPNLQAVVDGVVSADIAFPNRWLGWASIDQALRLIHAQEPVGSGLPIRLFTPDNLAGVDDMADEDQLYPFDYREQYRSLWQK